MALLELKKFSLYLNIIFIFLLFVYLNSPHNPQQNKPTNSSLILHESISDTTCTSVHAYTDSKAKCLYIKSQISCKPKGYINYLQIFYCTCGNYPFLGYTLLLLWLLVFFYLLGDTAANYFCSSLESLSKILRLSPTIAGVTLLSLGNGASDVFASIVSFTQSGDGAVGLNSVLGGAFFISSVVVGIISISISTRDVSVDKSSFVRDIIFFIISLSVLTLILFIGEINLWCSICFVSIYLCYVGLVSTSQLWTNKEEKELNPLLSHSKIQTLHVNDEFCEMGIPLLVCIHDEKQTLLEKTEDQTRKVGLKYFNLNSTTCHNLGKFVQLLELPLYLPRRLTIPVTSEEKWSKPYAVISVTLAPVLLSELFNSQMDKNSGSKCSVLIYIVAGFIGLIFGSLAFVTTNMSNPPKKWLIAWLVGGFLMSVTWTYITAEELVSLLVSIGNILEISPSVLGLTVLAWGNSLGDLIANLTMALNGGSDGTQTAISACYAGPMFNTLIGIGVSLVCLSISSYPFAYVIPSDPSLYETLGFLMGGLLWALVILPRKNMKLDKLLGFGLLAIYLCFISIRVARAFGVLR